MLKMILDTSSANLYVSFVDGEKEIYTKIVKTINNHSEIFLDKIQEGLEALNLKVEDFGAIIVGIGPGSYTGLRVSLTVAKMFSWTKNIPLYTVNSLYILGSEYYSNDGKYAIMNIAKKNHYYYQLLEVIDGKVKETLPAGFDSFEAVDILMKDYPEHKIIKFDDFRYSGVNISKLEQLQLIEDIHPLVPNYLRKEI